MEVFHPSRFAERVVLISLQSLDCFACCSFRCVVVAFEPLDFSGGSVVPVDPGGCWVLSIVGHGCIFMVTCR